MGYIKELVIILPVLSLLVTRNLEMKKHFFLFFCHVPGASGPCPNLINLILEYVHFLKFLKVFEV